VTYSGIPLTAMTMVPMADARARLGGSEPLSGVAFAAGDQRVRVRYDKGWADGDLTDPASAWIEVPDKGVYQMTFQAAQQLGSTSRIPQQLQVDWTPELQVRSVHWALHEHLGERQLKLLTAGQGQDPDGAPCPLAVAQTRAAAVPFSNLGLLDTVMGRVAAKYGPAAAASAVVDYKFEHDLEHTGMRIVIPGAAQYIQGTGYDDDAWCLGVEFTNSLIGLKPTTACGYLFRYICTNGQRDIANRPKPFSRRGMTEEDAYAWMAEAVDEIFAGLEDGFGHVQELTAVPVLPDVSTVLRDLFKQFGIPKARAMAVIETMADTGGDITMYYLLNATTLAANLPGLGRRSVDQLMAAGGHIIHSVGARCTGQLRHGCRRMLPTDWEEPSYEDVGED